MSITHEEARKHEKESITQDRLEHIRIAEGKERAVGLEKEKAEADKVEKEKKKKHVQRKQRRQKQR